MKTPKWIVIIVLVLSLCIPTTPVRAAPSASVRLTQPSPYPGFINGDVTFEIVIDTTDVIPGVAGAEMYVSYDPALVTPPASPLGVAVALPDFFGVADISIKELLPASQCPGGSRPCVRLVVAGPPQTNHSGAAARFFFRGVAEGLACFHILRTILVNADGFEVPHTIANPNPQCVEIVFRANVTGKVQRQGTPAIPNPGGGTLACSEIWSTSAGTTYGPVPSDTSGNFTLQNLPNGDHVLRADYSGYLSSQKLIAISSTGPTTIAAGTTTLRGGDVNGDDRINILDIGTIISKFGFTGVPVRSDLSDCTDPDEPADINDDGNINISDLAITAGNWGVVGPTSWQ